VWREGSKFIYCILLDVFRNWLMCRSNHMKSFDQAIFALTLLILGVPGLALAQGKAGLRIICDGEVRNAEVSINGKPSGSCPMDIEVPAGKIDLRVTKTGNGGTTRFFSETFSLGDGAIRRVEVNLNLMRPLVNHSRGETIDWIVSKLKRQMDGAFSASNRWTNANVQIGIEGNTLVVRYKLTHDGAAFAGYLHKIPIDSIREIQVVKSSDSASLFIDIERGCARCEDYYYDGTPIRDPDSRLLGFYNFTIKNDEDRLGERFNDAFQHLKALSAPTSKPSSEKF